MSFDENILKNQAALKISVFLSFRLEFGLIGCVKWAQLEQINFKPNQTDRTSPLDLRLFSGKPFFCHGRSPHMDEACRSAEGRFQDQGQQQRPGANHPTFPEQLFRCDFMQGKILLLC